MRKFQNIATAEWYLPEGRDLALRRILLAVCLLLTNE
jgi:hypothetical protein